MAALQFALAHDRGIETFLNELIEVIDAAGILVHRRQDLNSKFVARLLDFTAVQSADLRRPISFGLDFDEAKFQVFVDDRQASIVNQVGVSNDAAPFFLAENRIQANDGYHFRGDDVVEDGAAPTDGNWSASPTRMQRHCGFRAFSKWYIISISSIDTSSTMTKSAGNNFVSLYSKDWTLPTWPSGMSSR